MTVGVFPSTSNVGGGKPLSEQNLRSTGQSDYNWAIGLGLAASGALPAASVHNLAGEAFMGGRRITVPASEFTITGETLGPSVTRYIHLKVTCDGSANVASVEFTAETTCNWIAGTSPIVLWLCLGRVTTNGSSEISAIVNALHFPPHGRALVGAVDSAAEWRQNEPAANTAYAITGLAFAQAMAPRPAVLELGGHVIIMSDVRAHVFVDVMQNGAIARRRVAYTADPATWLNFDLSGSITLAAGALLTVQINAMVNDAAGTYLLCAGGAHHRDLCGWLSDSVVGM